jgi:hypothetical protein
VYCGEVDEISQPLFPIGMKTPISILHLPLIPDRQQAPCQRGGGRGGFFPRKMAQNLLTRPV